MGDRVAVMRKGELQQVGAAAGALRPPGQCLRRRLHRQPGDEHARGELCERPTGASRAARRAALDARRRALAPPPALEAYDGREVILGIRPEDLEDAGTRRRTRRRTADCTAASSCGRRSARRSWSTSIDAAPALTEEVRELAGRGRRRGSSSDRERPDARRSSAASAPARACARARRPRSPSTRARSTSSIPRPGWASTTDLPKGATTMKQRFRLSRCSSSRAAVAAMRLTATRRRR